MLCTNVTRYLNYSSIIYAMQHAVLNNATFMELYMYTMNRAITGSIAAEKTLLALAIGWCSENIIKMINIQWQIASVPWVGQ